MGQLKMREQNKGPFINTYGPGLQLKPTSENKQMGMGQLKMGKQNKGPLGMSLGGRRPSKDVHGPRACVNESDAI